MEMSSSRPPAAPARFCSAPSNSIDDSKNQDEDSAADAMWQGYFDEVMDVKVEDRDAVFRCYTAGRSGPVWPQSRLVIFQI